MKLARWAAPMALAVLMGVPAVAIAAGPKAKQGQEEPTDPSVPGTGSAPASASASAPASASASASAPASASASASEPAAVENGPKLDIHPYLMVSGGVKYDVVHGRPKENKQNRASTFALGRLGIKARWGELVSAESEFMASGGVGLHGASAYEGQAAMQVRQQVVRVHGGGFRLEAGRMIDEASVDFYSAHVAETFLQDTATRDALLFSGFNLGNGVRGQVQLLPGVRAAITFNAGNPVANTASLLIGGPYPPFERFYTQPYQAVNQGPNHFPDDTFHSMVLTPSILVDTPDVDIRLAFQGFDVNTNMNEENDDHIRGYNARGSMRVKLFDNHLVPFASAAYTRNDTLVPNNLAQRAADRYHAINLGGGVDLDVARRFKCAHDCADGFGAQYQQVQFQIGEGLVTTNRYVNVGGTFWISPNVSIGARFAMWTTKQEYSAYTGEFSGIAALRFLMQ